MPQRATHLLLKAPDTALSSRSLLFKIHNLKLKGLQGQFAPASASTASLQMAFSPASIRGIRHCPRLFKTAAQLHFLKDVLLTSRGICVIALINNDSSHF